MRTLLSAIFVALLSSAAPAQNAPVPLNFAGVNTLEVRLEAGDVRVEVGRGPATLRAETRGAVSFSQRRDGSTLRVSGTLPDTCMNCTLVLNLVIPAGQRVVVNTGAGRVFLKGATQSADLSSDAGDLETQDSGFAPLKLSSGAGKLRVLGASGKLEARTDAGDIVLERLSLPQGRHSARTGAGSIRVRGLGERPVRVVASSEAGRVSVPARFGRTEVRAVLELRTEAGEISVQ